MPLEPTHQTNIKPLSPSLIISLNQLLEAKTLTNRRYYEPQIFLFTMNTSTNTMDLSSCSVNSPPEEFICPISMSVMTNPLRHKKTGHVFERASIMNWIFLGNLVCPLTRQPLHTDDLVLDSVLQAKILEWKISQNFQESVADLDDDSDFEDTFNDILEITNRIKTVTIDHSRRRQAQPARARDEQEDRITGLRLRVLQQRDNRINNMLSNNKGDKGIIAVDPSSTETTSLAHMMARF
jgi:U-box domain